MHLCAEIKILEMELHLSAYIVYYLQVLLPSSILGNTEARLWYVVHMCPAA